LRKSRTAGKNKMFRGVRIASFLIELEDEQLQAFRHDVERMGRARIKGRILDLKLKRKEPVR
jgi:hypothetical protein